MPVPENLHVDLLPNATTVSRWESLIAEMKAATTADQLELWLREGLGYVRALCDAGAISPSDKEELGSVLLYYGSKSRLKPRRKS